MSPTTLRILIALVLFVHGVGHIMGILPALGVGRSVESWTLRSGLLSNLIGETAGQWVGVVLFALGFLGFIAATLALLDVLIPYDTWRTLAIVSAVISLVSLLLYWNAFVTLLNKGGAVLVNIAVLVCLLILHWPGDADLGM